MADTEVVAAVAGLAEAVLAVRPIVAALGRPVRVRSPQPWVGSGGSRPDGRSPAAVLAAVCDHLGVAVTVIPEAPPDGLDLFETVIDRWLADALRQPALTRVGPDGAAEIAAGVERAAAASFDRYRSRSDVVSFDGARLPAYAAGDPSAPAIVLASACGMPARLCDRWLDLLGRQYFVVTWESRGLFDHGADFDTLGWDTSAQAADVFAVMDHFDIASAHLMGFCGGSVIGLYAAGERPDRITSLSLWHGAYELGHDSPKLDHHRNIQALMAMAARDRASADAVYSVFLQTMLGSAPVDMAHLVLYPFATAELFYRYCRVNGAITDIDVRPLLANVRQPTLVVTSEDDDTANPMGSVHVAGQLPNAVLRTEPHGDHISLFKLGGRLGDLATEFLSGAPAGSGVAR